MNVSTTSTQAPVLVRACANCEQEQGILDRGDTGKTHGLCRRHFAELVRSAGFSDAEVAEAIKEVSATGFCPDLQETEMIRK